MVCSEQSRYVEVRVKTIVHLVAAMLISGVFWLADLDIMVSEFFFDHENSSFNQSQYWSVINKYLNVGPILLFIVSTVVLCGGCFIEKLAVYRKLALFCFLVMVIGPGLIVNGFFKTCWGRPRPYEVKQFGGTEEFVPALMVGARKPCRSDERDLAGKVLAVIGVDKQRHESFPSGHTSAAFYMIVLYFIAAQSKWRRSLLLFGVGYGLLMGVARIATGYHFLSDILWSGGIVWLTASALDSIMNEKT